MTHGQSTSQRLVNFEALYLIYFWMELRQNVKKVVPNNFSNLHVSGTL